MISAYYQHLFCCLQHSFRNSHNHIVSCDTIWLIKVCDPSQPRQTTWADPARCGLICLSPRGSDKNSVTGRPDGKLIWHLVSLFLKVLLYCPTSGFSPFTSSISTVRGNTLPVPEQHQLQPDQTIKRNMSQVGQSDKGKWGEKQKPKQTGTAQFL